MHLAILSKHDVSLSRYELECLSHARTSTLVDYGILIFDVPSSRIPLLKRLAFTRSILTILATTAPNCLGTALDKIDLNRRGSFAARIERSDEKIALPFPERHFARLIWQRMRRPRVDLQRPDTTFVLLITKKRWHVTQLLWTNTERFEDRRNHLLPEPHPTGLHPRLARSLVNILDKKSFLDPFCGAGGILIEGALAGVRVAGSDIDRIQVSRARINLAHFGFTNIPLPVRDATTLKARTPGIITDLPYGKNSRLHDLMPTYAGFLAAASRITKKVVLCLPDFVNERVLLNGTGWQLKRSFSHYIHRSLSKRILVLTR